MEKDILLKLVNSKMSVRDMAKHFSKSEGFVRYWMNKYGFKSKYNPRKWDYDSMVDAIRTSVTFADVLRKLSLQVRPGNYRTVKSFIKENNIDISHMSGQAHGSGGVKKKSLDELLVNGSKIRSTHLKERMLKEGLIENVCSSCGLEGHWNGEELKMVLDHINGISNDNRRENLRMLCPNCNSQQPTFCRGSKNYG